MREALGYGRLRPVVAAPPKPYKLPTARTCALVVRLRHRPSSVYCFQRRAAASSGTSARYSAGDSPTVASSLASAAGYYKLQGRNAE